MDGAGDTVVDLVVELWEDVLDVDGCIRDISNGSSFNHVSHGESLDGLVLGHASRAVGASHRLRVTSSVLVSAVVSSLESHG